MHTVYVLLPFFKIDSKTHIESKSMELLGFNYNGTSQHVTVHELNSNESALRISNFQLNFFQANSLIESYSQAQTQISILESVIKEYQFQTSFREESIGENVDHVVKKMKKYKELKQENKKLKKLLQAQLENTEKVRQQTQKTMKVLREQFDALVTQISKKQKIISNSPHYQFLNSESIEPQSKQKVTLSNQNTVKHSLIR